MPKPTESAPTSKRKIAVKKTALDKTTSPAWEAFSERLIAALQSLEAGQWLILQKQGVSEWVQFAAEGKGAFRIEVKSNWFRELDEELTLEQQELLSRIGWREPTGSDTESTPASDPCGSPNYWLDLTLPRNANKLVNVTAATFTDVIGVVEPEGLMYEAFYVNGDSLSLPQLGLKPLVVEHDNSQNPSCGCNYWAS
jgi:hypothetical protein